MRKTNYKPFVISIIACSFSILLFQVFSKFPLFAESVYGQIVYPFYQSIRSLLGFLPNSLLYYTPFILVFVLLLNNLIKVSKKKKSFLSFPLLILSIVACIVTIFYTAWGFNYARPSLESRLDLEIDVPDSSYIFSDLSQTITLMNDARAAIPIKDTIAWYDDSFSKEAQKKLNENVASFLKEYGYKTNFTGFVHELKPKGVLRRFGSAGMFMPLTGEAYYDSAVPNISRPNTYAHELSHVFGVTNEGECNLIAYVACLTTDDPMVQYSGLLSYYRYAASTAYLTDSLQFRAIEKNMSNLVKADIQSKRKCGLLYPDFFPKTRDAVYDRYLKTQGIKTGIKDYSKLYLLVYAMRKQEEKL